MKASIMAGIDAKLSQNQESMWRRGLKEIKRLQSEQQDVMSVVNEMQEKQDALVTENQQLREALCEVTMKFEQVVNEMRQALRILPQRGAHHGQVSPSPSVASTAASDVASPGLGGLLHATELAQGRVHVGHLERALQRYGQLPGTFEEAWMKLTSISEKAHLVSELNILIESRLEVSTKAVNARDECRTLLAQYEDALRNLQKAALLVLETQNPRQVVQDESFTEPTPPSSKGNVSAMMGLTPSWPTCTDDTGETFCTPPRVSLCSEDQSSLGEACWQTWQSQYRPSPSFSGIANASSASAPLAASPPAIGGSPAVLSLASALATVPAGYASPAAPPASWGLLRPEARVFVPSAQAEAEAEAETAAEAEASSFGEPSASMPTITGANKAGTTMGTPDESEDGVARLLFP